jgi:hypothetical protein
MAYVGAESGDDEVLAKVNKGETHASTCEALDKLQQAGIKRSVMILNGLGGGVRCHVQHAENSARLANATQPEFLATLVVNFPMGEARFAPAFQSGSRAANPNCLPRWSASSARWNCGAPCFAPTMFPIAWC